MKTLLTALLIPCAAIAAPADDFIAAWKNREPLPRLTVLEPDADLARAYAVQREWVMKSLAPPGLGGVKAGYVTPAAQELLKLDEPLAALLRAEGRLGSRDRPVVSLAKNPGLKIETEIGFVVGKKITTAPADLAEFKSHITSVVPVVELPAGSWDAPEGTPNPADVVAINISSAAYIVGDATDAAQVDFSQVKLTFHKDGELLHEGAAKDNWHGPWETAMWLAGFAIRQGIELEPGQIIICGALGKIHPGAPGDYIYDAGRLDSILFTITNE